MHNYLFIVLQLVPEEGLHGQRKKTKASLLYGHHKLDRCPTRSNLNGSWKTLEAEEAGWWCGPIYSIWWKTLVIVDGSRCLYRSGVTAYVKVNQVYIPTPCIKILFGTLWMSNYYYTRSIFCILKCFELLLCCLDNSIMTSTHTESSRQN